MKPRSKSLRVTATVLAALVLPASAAAQYWLPPLTVVAKADSLHTAARILAQTSHRWRDAARLHQQSAALRPLEDPLGFRCLSEAAQLSYAGGDRSGARTDMARAAAQALTRGDLEKAAHAYLDAAWIAQEQGKSRQVWELGRRAEILAASPLLNDAQRSLLFRRIEHKSTVMAIRHVQP
jgi:hypothetical protein